MFLMLLFPKFPCPQLNPKPSTSVGCVVGPSVNWLSNLFFLPKSFFGSLIEFSMTIVQYSIILHHRLEHYEFNYEFFNPLSFQK